MDAMLLTARRKTALWFSLSHTARLSSGAWASPSTACMAFAASAATELLRSSSASVPRAPSDPPLPPRSPLLPLLPSSSAVLLVALAAVSSCESHCAHCRTARASHQRLVLLRGDGTEPAARAALPHGALDAAASAVREVRHRELDAGSTAPSPTRAGWDHWPKLPVRRQYMVLQEDSLPKYHV